MKNYLITFYTHNASLKFKKICKLKSVPCELMPVPRKLSSSCGVCAKIQSELDPQRDLMVEDIDGIYIDSDGAYEAIFKNE